MRTRSPCRAYRVGMRACGDSASRRPVRRRSSAAFDRRSGGCARRGMRDLVRRCARQRYSERSAGVAAAPHVRPGRSAMYRKPGRAVGAHGSMRPFGRLRAERAQGRRCGAGRLDAVVVRLISNGISDTSSYSISSPRVFAAFAPAFRARHYRTMECADAERQKKRRFGTPARYRFQMENVPTGVLQRCRNIWARKALSSPESVPNRPVFWQRVPERG